MPFQETYSGAISQATAKEKRLKKLAEGRHIVPGQQAQRKKKFDGTPLGGFGWDNIGWLWIGQYWVALDGIPLGGSGWDTFGWLWMGHFWVDLDGTLLGGSGWDTIGWLWMGHL